MTEQRSAVDNPTLYEPTGMRPQCTFIVHWHSCRLDAGHPGRHSPGRVPATEPAAPDTERPCTCPSCGNRHDPMASNLPAAPDTERVAPAREWRSFYSNLDTGTMFIAAADDVDDVIVDDLPGEIATALEDEHNAAVRAQAGPPPLDEWELAMAMMEAGRALGVEMRVGHSWREMAMLTRARLSRTGEDE